MTRDKSIEINFVGGSRVYYVTVEISPLVGPCKYLVSRNLQPVQVLII